jgi:phytoene desaturase
MKEVIVIGGGLGGLATACRLAKSGFSVTIVEKNERLGGKVNLIEANGYRFDTGASLLTLPDILQELFNFCERDLTEYLSLVPLDPICRYLWEDGATLDIYKDLELTKKAIAQIAPEDLASLDVYIRDARAKYEISKRTFLATSLNNLPKILSPSNGRFFKNLSDLLRISSLKTLDKHNKSYFRSPKLRQLFNRYATYNGSSPYKIPATFALIPYVEFGFGAWYPIGGIYEIPKSLEKLARELGVSILTKTEVKKIVVEDSRAIAVETPDKTLKAHYIVSNADGVETYRRLLSINNRFVNREPSCSEFVLMIGAKKRFPNLAHHNIFFSEDYESEFEQIFDKLLPPDNPTIYVCATSRTDSTQAPDGCENLFIMVNAPYLTEKVNWSHYKKPYRDLIIEKLEKAGLDGLEKSIEFEATITPEDFAQNTYSNKGSIYGISSNGILSAFLRIPNKSREIDNLYFVGGATHPGGGIPLVLLSARMTCDMIVEENLGVQRHGHRR